LRCPSNTLITGDGGERLAQEKSSPGFAQGEDREGKGKGKVSISRGSFRIFRPPKKGRKSRKSAGAGAQDYLEPDLRIF